MRDMVIELSPGDNAGQRPPRPPGRALLAHPRVGRRPHRFVGAPGRDSGVNSARWPT